MAGPAAPKIPFTAKERVEIYCSFGAAFLGFVLIVYYTPWFLGLKTHGLSPEALAAIPPGMLTGMGIYVVAMGLLSIAAAVGYALKARWGWFVHIVAAAGMLAFPGTLFEFRLDAHHMVAWASTLLTLVMVIAMGVARRKQGVGSRD